MRILYALPVVAVLLGGCAAPTPEQIDAAIKGLCGIVVPIGDIAVLITAGSNPLFNSADSWAKQVCDAYKAQHPMGAAAASAEGTIVVNGTTIHFKRAQ